MVSASRWPVVRPPVIQEYPDILDTNPISQYLNILEIGPRNVKVPYL